MESQYDEYVARATGKTYRVYNFDTIENPTDAYFVGLVATNGAYTYNKEKNFPRMSFSSNNKHIITAMRDRYCIGVDVMDRSNRVITVNNRTYQNESYELNFPIGLTRSLANFGVARSKPERTMVRIPKAFISAYILGIIDGDGSIVVRHRKDCRTPRLNIHIVTGAEKLAEQVQRMLEDDLNIASSIYKRNENCVDLRINNTNRAVEFCQWIYSNLPSFYNIGKKKIFDEYYQNYCS